MSTELLDSLDEVVEAPQGEGIEEVSSQPEAEAKEPEVKAEAEPKAAEPPKEVPKAEHKPEPKTIPLASYLEDKNRWTQKLEAMERELTALKNPPKAPPPEPDFQEDPKGYVDTKLQAALQKLEGTVIEAKTEATSANQAAIEARFTQDMASLEAEFVRQVPDYFDALGHIRNIRAMQLRAFDPNITDDQIRGVIAQEEKTLAFNLARQNRNPAQVAYQLAQGYGYKKAEPKDEPKIELPKVEGQPKQLPPDQTLGTGSAPAGESDEKQGDEFEDAFNELFGRRKSA